MVWFIFLSEAINIMLQSHYNRKKLYLARIKFEISSLSFRNKNYSAIDETSFLEPMLIDTSKMFSSHGIGLS